MNLIKTFSITMIFFSFIKFAFRRKKSYFVFSGQFDIIDKEGDDKTHLVD